MTNYNILIGAEVGCLDPAWNYFECLDWLNKNNFDEVELFCAPRRGALFSVLPGEVNTAALKKKLQGFKKVDLHAPYHHDWDISLVSVNPRIREAYFADMEDVASMGMKLGVDVITVHTGGTHGSATDEDKMKDLVIEGLHCLNALAEKYHVRFAFENCDYFSMVDRFDIIISANLPPIGITFDIGHANLNYIGMPLGGLSTYPALQKVGTHSEAIRKYSRKIFHIHLHDNLGDNDFHLHPGRGKIDFKDIFRAIREIDYKGALCFEIYFTSLKDILKSRDFVNEAINR